MAIKYGPTIPGLGVNYTSPAVAPRNNARNNAINIRQTGATAGESTRFANMAPAGTTTRPLSANSALGLGQQASPLGGTAGETNRFRNLQRNVNVTSTGALVSQPVPTEGSSAGGSDEGSSAGGSDAGGPAGGSGAGGSGAGGSGAGGSGAGGSGAGGSGAGGSAQRPEAAAPIEPPIDAAAALDSAINALLDPEFIGFQGDRAAELRRLQNLRNQLFGDAEFGQTGSVQRQEGLNEQSRRRLAAQRASAGMLQGGSYAGTERGLGTLQRADQDFAMQEMQRPFREQTASDRLREFGLEFDPTNRIFDQMDMDQAGFATQTQAGREAAARAKLAAIQQLAQQGIQI